MTYYIVYLSAVLFGKTASTLKSKPMCFASFVMFLSDHYQQTHDPLPLHHGCATYKHNPWYQSARRKYLYCLFKATSLAMPLAFVQSLWVAYISKDIKSIPLLGFHNFWWWELKFSCFQQISSNTIFQNWKCWQWPHIRVNIMVHLKLI